MLVLLLALMGQVKHGEILWTPQKGPLTRWVDTTGIDVRPKLVKYVQGEEIPTKVGLVQSQINTINTEFGSYFVFEKKFSGTPRWTFMLGNEMINRPRIFGYYEDKCVILWGVNFQDLYGAPPKVYLVTDIVTELPLLRIPGDRQQKQGYYENPYLIRVNPPTSGHIVVYTGEMGLYGCDYIKYTKPLSKQVIELKEDMEYLEVPPGIIYKGKVNVGRAIINRGGELHGVTIKRGQPYSVRMLDNAVLKDCEIENWADESVCVQIYGRGVRLEKNKLRGIRACGVMTETSDNVVIHNEYEGGRYTTSGTYFPVGSCSVIADNEIKNSYRALIVQANNGPVRHNLILRNDIVDGGIDRMGGEQIIFETKAQESTAINPKVGETVMVVAGKGKGYYWIQTPTGPDRYVEKDETSVYASGNIATENLFILNRVKDSRIGLELWKYSVGNVVCGLQCSNVVRGFVQQCGKEHGYAFHNEIRDSFLQQSNMTLCAIDGVDHMLNTKTNRVEFINSQLLSYNVPNRLTEAERARPLGEGLFLFKCDFGATEAYPLGIDAPVPTPRLPYRVAQLDIFRHIVVRDCRLNGDKATLEELNK